MSTVGYDAFGVRMEEVLFDTRQAPLSRESLRQFLEREQAQENLDFWIEVQRFKQEALGEQFLVNGKPVRLEVGAKRGRQGGADVEEGTTEPLSWARRIVQWYVGEKAEKAQINISGQMTDKLLQDVSEDKVPDFAPPQKETVSMMTIPFQRWVQKSFEQNIDDKEVDFRRVLAAVLMVILLAMGLLLQYLAVQPGLFPRWGLFLSVLPVSYNQSYFMWSAYWKL